jgi:hypothetical protein
LYRRDGLDVIVLPERQLKTLFGVAGKNVGTAEEKAFDLGVGLGHELDNE